MKRLRLLALAASLLAWFTPNDAAAVQGGIYGLDTTFDLSTGVPNGGLALGADGFFYGVAQVFGVGNGEGTIYRYASGRSPTVVHRFIGYPNGNEGTPVARLIRMPDDSLWGITFTGGDRFIGTVFRFDPASGAAEIVHSFDYDEGGEPFGRLLLASDGYVYGTTSQYGAFEGGTIFRIDPATRSFETVWAFGSQPRYGRSPAAGLTEGPDGRLYGLTGLGGAPGDAGSLFAFDAARRTMSLVASFPSSAGYFEQEVTFVPDGSIYGVTQDSRSGECGSVFSVRPDGRQFRVRHVFDCVHGAYPHGALLLASDGYLYGVVTSGPLYRIRPGRAGSFAILHASRGPDASTPSDDELLEADGAIRGVTNSGGAEAQGVAFTFRPEEPAR